MEEQHFSVTVGCYEKFIFGFDLKLCFVPQQEKNSQDLKQLQEVKEEKIEATLIPSFSCATHSGCVKCIDSFDNILVSGSTDESISLFDLNKRIESGSLIKHQGAITCIKLFKNTHLFSGSEDGTIGIWRTYDWQCQLILRGHKGSILSISIHPSGKLALSTSKDATLKMWNLLKGKSAFTIKLKSESEIIEWSPKGTSYALVTGSKITLHAISNGQEVQSFQHEKHILSLKFVTDNILAAGGEDKIITLWNAITGEILQKIEGHTNRIKDLAIAFYDHNSLPLLISISSDGFIKVWNINTTKANILAETPTTARLTCLCCSPLSFSSTERQTSLNETETVPQIDEIDENEGEADQTENQNLENIVTGKGKHVSETVKKTHQMQVLKKDKKPKKKKRLMK